MRLVERDEHAAPRVQPLADADAPPARRQEGRRLRVHREVVHARALHPPELEHVLEALGGEDGRHRALLLEDRVGGDGGAVDEAFDVAGLGAGDGEDATHGVGDALEQVLRRARDLRECEPAIAVERHDVGERPADVDADLHPPPPLPPTEDGGRGGGGGRSDRRRGGRRAAEWRLLRGTDVLGQRAARAKAAAARQPPGGWAARPPA